MNEYITKEAAIEAVEDTNIELFLSEWKEIEEKINAIPTADVVSVVYGHWIWHEEEFEYECSACHCRFDYNHTFEIFDNGFQYANYCPNCGVKMNGSKWEDVQHNG